MTTTQGEEVSVTVNKESFSGLQQLYVQPMYAQPTYQIMTPGFKHFTVLYPTAIPSSGYLMTTKSLVCGVIIVC